MKNPLPVITMDDEDSAPTKSSSSYELFGGQDEAPKGSVRKAEEFGTGTSTAKNRCPKTAGPTWPSPTTAHVIRLYVDGKLGNDENSTDAPRR